MRHLIPALDAGQNSHSLKIATIAEFGPKAPVFHTARAGSATRNRFEFANTRHYRQRRAKAPALSAAIEGDPNFLSRTTFQWAASFCFANSVRKSCSFWAMYFL